MATTNQHYDVKDLELAPHGRNRVEWADAEMPVLRLIRERFSRERPLQGMRLSACLHVTAETANLMRTLKAGGAEIRLCASNPLSTQDDVAAALVEEYGVPTFAIKGEDETTYYRHIESALEHGPQLTMDDGADLVTVLHTRHQELLDGVSGGTEETTTGIIRLRSMATDGVLRYPIIGVNEANTKHLFDNRYGTGQSTIDGILRATNVLLAGKTVVVVGFGWVGRGIASRARGMGANVVITEVHPVAGLEALMEGYRVMPLLEAAALGDIFITATGNRHVIDEPHLLAMRDGALIANSGHFNVEINIPALEQSAQKRRTRDFVDEYRYPDGRRLYLLGEGRLINLAAAEGHPPAVMDMSFANQALSAEYLATEHEKLERRVYTVPEQLDLEIARLKLQAMGVRIDLLSAEQEHYLAAWDQGT